MMQRDIITNIIKELDIKSLIKLAHLNRYFYDTITNKLSKIDTNEYLDKYIIFSNNSKNDRKYLKIALIDANSVFITKGKTISYWDDRHSNYIENIDKKILNRDNIIAIFVCMIYKLKKEKISYVTDICDGQNYYEIMSNY